MENDLKFNKGLFNLKVNNKKIVNNYFIYYLSLVIDCNLHFFSTVVRQKSDFLSI